MNIMHNYSLHYIDNVWYRKSGWLGCQLESVQFRFPGYVERRTILGHEFKIFGIERTWKYFCIPMWRVSWTLVKLNDLKLDEKNELIRKFYKLLGEI